MVPYPSGDVQAYLSGSVTLHVRGLAIAVWPSYRIFLSEDVGSSGRFSILGIGRKGMCRIGNFCESLPEASESLRH